MNFAIFTYLKSELTKVGDVDCVKSKLCMVLVLICKYVYYNMFIFTCINKRFCKKGNSKNRPKTKLIKTK